MGVLTDLKRAFGVGLPRPDYLASPLTTNSLPPMVAADLFGEDYLPVPTREVALSIPAVSKAVDLLCGPISALPLRAANVDGVLPRELQPSFLYRTDADMHPSQRINFTLQDLFFYGTSLWARVNGADGFPLMVERIPHEQWTINADGHAVVNGAEVADENVIFFFSHKGVGFLDIAAGTITGALDIEKAWRGRVRNPTPVIELRATDDELTEAEIRDLIASTSAALRKQDGSVIFTPNGIELITHGNVSTDLLVEGRNAVRLDVAAFAGIPGSLLDASTVTSTLTYETTQGRNAEFVDYGLSPWMNDITSRLSMNDVLPNGSHCVFDLSHFTSPAISPTGPAEIQD